MTLKLILMRHAKSAWDNPTQDDFDRPLNGRGRASAEAIGNWLVAHHHLPDEVIVSGARRTVETWSRMAHLFDADTAMSSNPALYLGSADLLLGVLKTAKSPTIMLIAHNPGIGKFANDIVKAPADHPKFAQYPTGATSIISFEAEIWEDVAWATGEIANFAIPRDLMA